MGPFHENNMFGRHLVRHLDFSELPKDARVASLGFVIYYMSRIVRKPDFCLCENKGADQLRSNCEADQRLCFRYSDSTIPLLLIAKISSLLPASVAVQADLCQTWSETPKTGFLASRLIYPLSKNAKTFSIDGIARFG